MKAEIRKSVEGPWVLVLQAESISEGSLLCAFSQDCDNKLSEIVMDYEWGYGSADDAPPSAIYIWDDSKPEPQP